METIKVVAKGRYIRQSPYKVRLVLDLLRNEPVVEAINILKFTKRRAAEEILKILNSAVSNAENNFGLSVEKLYIVTAVADEGPTLKRFRPRARGRASRINKRMCHVTIELAEVEGWPGHHSNCK